MIMDLLKEIEVQLTRVWDETAKTGKIYIDDLEVLPSLNKENLGLYIVPLERFATEKTDILVGLFVSKYAREFKNDITITGNNVTLAEITVLRGRKRFLDQPIPLIALQRWNLNISLNSYWGIPTGGIYAICARCDNPLRAALVQNKYVWGKWLYADGMAEEAPANRCKDIIVKPERPNFGGIIYGESKFDENGKIVNKNIELVTEWNQTGVEY
jgi:hypothetical protein